MAHWAVCPLLTILVFYYLIMVDYEGSIRQIYLSSVLGITASFFVLVFFSEVWLISSLVFAPLIGFYLWKTSHSLGGVNWVEFSIQTVFAVFAYTTTAYKVELLQKQSYLGKESYEKSFNRWLKIFETFPEGIAMIRNTEAIMYANSALKKLLDGDDGPSEPERLNDQYSDVGVRFNQKEHVKIKELLEQTRIQKISKDKKPNAKYKEQSIWDFLERNENGATFEIKGRAAKGDRLEGLDSSE